MEEHITMLDSSVDIPLLLKASNYQLLPSIYEGFGNVLIEAQAAGVPSFVSDACQPEPDLGLIDYIPLNKGAVYWADYILERIEKPDSRKVDIFGLMKYDTINVAKRMQKVYLEGCKYEDTL
jgi:glycosyltransferase involved in cell wall biosynthesis